MQNMICMVQPVTVLIILNHGDIFWAVVTQAIASYGV